MTLLYTDLRNILKIEIKFPEIILFLVSWQYGACTLCSGHERNPGN